MMSKKQARRSLQRAWRRFRRGRCDWSVVMERSDRVGTSPGKWKGELNPFFVDVDELNGVVRMEWLPIGMRKR